MATLISKGDFAARRGVSPAAVSQWISGGKISGAALVGTGRMAKINVEEAERQLGVTLDPAQQLHRQGVRPTASAAPPAALPDPADDHQARYARARADSAEIEAERARRRIQEERGRYVLADAAAEAFSRELAEMVQAGEQWVMDAGAALAAELGTDAKTTTAALRRQWRALRSRWAAEAAARRDGAPAFAADPDMDGEGAEREE